MNADQIRAARAILNMTRKDLYEATGIHPISLGKIENGEANPRGATLEALSTFFEENGVDFVNGGVTRKDDQIQVLEGKDDYLRLLDDVYYTLKEKRGEALFLFTKPGISPAEVLEKQHTLQNAGIPMRFVVEEGETTIPLSEARYHALPSDLFHNSPKVIYADKVAVAVDDNRRKRILVIKNASFAETEKKVFEIIWKLTRKIA